MQRLKVICRWIIFAICIVLLVLPACLIGNFAKAIVALTEWWLEDAMAMVVEWLEPSHLTRGEG